MLGLRFGNRVSRPGVWRLVLGAWYVSVRTTVDDCRKKW